MAIPSILYCIHSCVVKVISFFCAVHAAIECAALPFLESEPV